MTIKIPVEAQLSTGDVDKATQQLVQQMNKLAATIAQTNKVKFTPIDKATISDLQKVTSQFESLKRISGDFNKRLKATGQSGSGFFDLDWNKLYSDPHARARQMRKTFEYVAAGTGAGFAAPSPSSEQPEDRPGGPSVGRQIVSSGLRAAGPVGGVVDKSISTGLSSGATAGMAGLAGGLVALGVGKVVGGVMNKVGDAQNEAVGYDTLKRMLGDVNVSFGVLERSLRSTSGALDLTYNEGQKLATEFVKIANISSQQYKTVHEEVRTSSGFGRSFGVDPSESNQFFAQMRQFRVTSNDTDSRKLALMIGESIAKSSSFAKTDEVLQSIASFTAQQTRMGMTSANVGDFAGLLTGLVNSKTPGLDVTGSAALLSRVNSSIAGGGNAGEAGQNFMYTAIGKPLGLDPIQSAIMREQGAFGTGKGTFGKGSLYSKFADKYGLSTPGGAAGSSSTNLQMIMQQMKKVYANNPELMLSAMSNLLGTNMSQSMALSTFGPEQLGKLEGRLKKNGIDIKDVNATGISRIAQVEADPTKTDAQKDRLIKALASKEQEHTVGSDTRASRTALENIAQDLASKLIPAINTMKDGIIFLAGNGKKSASQITADIAKLEYAEAAAPINARKKEIANLLSGELNNKSSYFNIATPEKRQQILQKRAQAEAEMKSLDGQLGKLAVDRDARVEATKPKTASSTPGTSTDTVQGKPGSGPLGNDPWLRGQLAETDRTVGLPSGTSAAQMMQESGFNPKAVSKVGAMGLAQVMPKTLLEIERRFGRKLDPYDPKDAVVIQRELMRENMSKFGNTKDALSAYNSGWDKGKWNNAETANYAPNIMRNAGQYATPVPSGGTQQSAQRQQPQRVAIEGSFTLNHPNGAPAASPVTIKKEVGAAAPFGGR